MMNSSVSYAAIEIHRGATSDNRARLRAPTTLRLRFLFQTGFLPVLGSVKDRRDRDFRCVAIDRIDNDVRQSTHDPFESVWDPSGWPRSGNGPSSSMLWRTRSITRRAARGRSRAIQA